MRPYGDDSRNPVMSRRDYRELGPLPSPSFGAEPLPEEKPIQKKPTASGNLSSRKFLAKSL